MVAIIGWNPEGGKCAFSLLFLNLLSKTCLRPQVCVDTSNSCESNMKRTELNHVLPFLSPIEPLSCQSHGCQLCLQPSFGTVDRHYIAGLNLFPWLKATCPPNGIRDPKWSSTSPFRCNMVGCKVKKNYVTRKRTKKQMVPGRLRLHMMATWSLMIWCLSLGAYRCAFQPGRTALSALSILVVQGSR